MAKRLPTLIALILVTIISSGCANREVPLTIIKEEIPRQQLNLPDPEPIKLSEVPWKVITENNYYVELPNFKNGVMFALDDEGYKALAKNMFTLTGYILKLKQLISQYRDYYEPKSTEPNADR